MTSICETPNFVQIRFKVENHGKTLMEKLEKAEKIVIKDMEVKPSLLEGEEEDQFLADSLRDLKNQKQKNKNHRGRAANWTMVGSGSSAKIKRPDQPVYTPAFLYINGGSSLWSIHKESGDIAFITYQKGEAEAKVGVVFRQFWS